MAMTVVTVTTNAGFHEPEMSKRSTNHCMKSSEGPGALLVQPNRQTAVCVRGALRGCGEVFKYSRPAYDAMASSIPHDCRKTRQQ